MEMILEEATCDLTDIVAPTSSQTGYGYLIALDSEGLFEHVFRIDQEAHIGRSHECHIRVRQKDVSRVHARVWSGPHGWQIEDLNSRNGTKVNQTSVKQTSLSSRDDIQMAGNAFRFLIASEPELSYHRAVELIASTDSLTNLHNRDFIKRKTLDTLSCPQPPAFVIVDIDRFKEINDKHGHLVGDEVLLEIANRIQQASGSDGIAARISGDEFAVLVPAPHLLDLERFADSICQVVSATPIMTTVEPMFVTVSVGVAVANSETRSISGIMAAADRQLYTSKQNGRDCASVSR